MAICYAPSTTNARMARWRSGDAADCKSVYAGSIPARASNSSRQFRRLYGFVKVGPRVLLAVAFALFFYVMQFASTREGELTLLL